MPIPNAQVANTILRFDYFVKPFNIASFTTVSMQLIYMSTSPNWGRSGEFGGLVKLPLSSFLKCRYKFTQSSIYNKQLFLEMFAHSEAVPQPGE